MATQQKITEVTNSRHIAQLIGSTIKSFQNKEVVFLEIINEKSTNFAISLKFTNSWLLPAWNAGKC